MSEKEKKAIEIIKENAKDGDNFWYHEVIPNISILLKLVDKQQKEIEELKERKKDLVEALKSQIDILEELLGG